jgi:hypothetical protein
MLLKWHTKYFDLTRILKGYQTQVVYFVNIDKNINTSFKVAFETIPTKISQFYRWS